MGSGSSEKYSGNSISTTPVMTMSSGPSNSSRRSTSKVYYLGDRLYNKIMSPIVVTEVHTPREIGIRSSLIPGTTVELLRPYTKFVDGILVDAIGQGEIICIMGVFNTNDDWGRTVFTVVNNRIIQMPLWWAALNCKLLEPVTNHGTVHE